MQRVLGYMRRAVLEFDMISDGDRVAVGVSGGKDSMALLSGLSRMRRFLGVNYEITGITLDPMFGGKPTDYSSVSKFCSDNGIEYIIRQTNIGQIVFDIRKEEHPCSLCARMRRGALHDAAKELGCNKVALGHHFDDATETFLMNLFHEGRIGCFAPKSYLSRKDLYLIRPLCFAPEEIIKSAVSKEKLPVVKSVCPADGITARQAMKEFIKEKEAEEKGFADRIFGAMRRANINGWGGSINST